MKKLLTTGLLLSLFLSGCGFALRGTAIPLPERFLNTYIDSSISINDAFQRRIKKLITLGGGRIVNKEEATIEVHLDKITQSSRQVALSGDKLVKEYERTYKTSVTVIDLTNDIQLGSRKFSSTHNLQLDETHILSGEERSNLTLETAERDLAKQVLGYLKTF